MPRKEACGGHVPFWSLRFADGGVLRASAEASDGRHLTPVVRWTGRPRRGLYPLLAKLGGYGDVELIAVGSNVCSNGWHHYSLVASTTLIR